MYLKQYSDDRLIIIQKRHSADLQDVSKQSHVQIRQWVPK